MTRVDIHQHLWSEPLVRALEARRRLPFIRRERGLTVLYLGGERPYVIDLDAEAPARRAGLAESDGLDRVLLCLSSPLGIEWLAREESVTLIDAYHHGALSLGAPFEVWGAVPLEQPDGADVDRALELGCVGISLPAGALCSVDALSRLDPVLTRLEFHGAPLFVHPGPGGGAAAAESSLTDPLWWPAMTSYVASMQAAWLAFLTAGRSRHPELRVAFAMLAALAPLHFERLSARGCAVPNLADPDVFYDTSSYGPSTVGLLEKVVGPEQILHGSDRPVVDPRERGLPDAREWAAIAERTDRLLGAGQLAPAL